jgi:hypothetical protein
MIEQTLKVIHSTLPLSNLLFKVEDFFRVELDSDYQIVKESIK